MGYATADVGEGRRARASRLPVVDRICSSTLERARFPGPAPLVDTLRRTFPSWSRMAESASAVAILPGPRTARAVLGRPARRRARCRPAGGWGPAAVARRRTQNSSIFIIVDKCTAPLRSSRPFRRRAVGRGGGWAVGTTPTGVQSARALEFVSIKIELSEVSDVYKTKMGSSTVHAEESRYRRHPECLPLGTRTANMEQHKHAERSEPELPPGALALAPRPPI